MPDAPTDPPRGLVRPEFGPTLPALLERRGVAPRVTLGVVAALLVACAAAFLVLRDPLDGNRQFVHRDRPVFNLLYGGGLRLGEPQGDELVRVTGRRGGVRVTLTVRPYALPPYEGTVDGVLPIVMTNLARGYERPGLEVLRDGKGRISDAPGYQNEFRYREGDRRIYGLDVLIVPPEEPQARRGLLASLRQVRGTGRPRPAGRRLTSAARSSLRSLRFGTELDYPD